MILIKFDGQELNEVTIIIASLAMSMMSQNLFCRFASFKLLSPSVCLCVLDIDV